MVSKIPTLWIALAIQLLNSSFLPVIPAADDEKHPSLPVNLVALDSIELLKAIGSIEGLDTPKAASAVASIILDTSSAPLKLSLESPGWSVAFRCLNLAGKLAFKTSIHKEYFIYSEDSKYVCPKDSYEWIESDPEEEQHQLVLVQLDSQISIVKDAKNAIHLEVVGKCPIEKAPTTTILRLQCSLTWDQKIVSVRQETSSISPMLPHGSFCEKAYKIFENKPVSLDAVQWGERGSQTEFLELPNESVTVFLEGRKDHSIKDMRVRVRFPDVFQQSGFLKQRFVQHPRSEEYSNQIPGTIVQVWTEKKLGKKNFTVFSY